ncbi:dynein heavy chain domain-containing protein 1-like isoform X3 [Dunckerocampus dactyliophorus]|uniref:dynein heavy chain domain-containing protein 1-like isoform X3 n=1 Tax=Dunckerocampus dactyliophorus TaxID=161453 RepID=UPI002406B4B1|nr:dynein heavy chain domain-containing protein 1-like isoform X3 [Dunckerocampus dactyliophorus]
MEPPRRTANLGKPTCKPKKKDPSPVVANSQATLPPLWPVPYCLSASSLRRNLFDPSAIVFDVPSDTSGPVAQTESGKVLTETKWIERLRSRASVKSCTDNPDTTADVAAGAQSFTEKDDSRVTINHLFSLPAIVPPESPRSAVSVGSVNTILEPKWTEKPPRKASASCTDIPAATADEAAAQSYSSFTEKDDTRVARRDFLNLPFIAPSISSGSPRLAASRKGIIEIKWTEKNRAKSSLSCADIPVTAADDVAAQSLTETDDFKKQHKKASLVEKVPVTGMEIVQMFVKNRDVGELKLFYLKEPESDTYRPYDLQVVPASEAGPEHYVFTASTVLHVTQKGYGGLISLEEWYRESVLWAALQAFPFFRAFRLRNAFTRWYKNVRETVFNRNFEQVQAQLLPNIPQYRNGLLLLSKTLEELKATHLLPLEESKTYTLLEFQKVLLTSMQDVLHSLRRLSQCRVAILSKAKEESFKAQQELQLHLEYADKQHHCCKPIHLHQAHLHELQREFARAESIMQKLGNFATLIDQIIVQSLITIILHNTTSFLDVLKRETSLDGCLFQTDLCFSDDSQLSLDPPLHLFQETVSQALQSVADSICQMCDTCGFFLEVNSSSLGCQDKTPDLSCSPSPVFSDSLGEIQDTMPGHTHYSCCQWIREQRPNWTRMALRGHRIPGSFYRLSKEQLVWHIAINDVSKHVCREQAELMQEAESEMQQQLECNKWLVDVHVFLTQWSPTSLENMKGQPATLYQELIEKLRHWMERVHTVPSLISTSNQLFIIHCSRLKEHLGQQLTLIETEVQEQVFEQMKLHSESFLCDLEEAITDLRMEPKDLHDFAKYADMVWKSMNMLAETQKRLEYVQSLRDNICQNYRAMTTQGLNLEQKMVDIWNSYYSHLNQAESNVFSRVPTVANALDTMFPLLASDLKSMVCKATSGPFLDPRQNADKLASELNYMCLRVETITANLEQLCQTGEVIQENPVDLTDLTDINKLTARKELWELIALYRRRLHGWKKVLFIKLDVSQSQENISQWQQQVATLTNTIPADDAVLQETSENLENLNRQFNVLARFLSPPIKPKHRNSFFQGVGLMRASDKNVTVAQLIYQRFDVHQKFINKICSDAQHEYEMEQTFQKIQEEWINRMFQLHNLTGPCRHNGEREVSEEDLTSDTYCDVKIFIGLEIIFTDIEHDLMTLTNMQKSRHSADFRLQVEEWMHSLQDLEKLLHFFEIYQQKWIFLSNTFEETSLGVQRWDLLAQFKSVDKTFKTMLHCISNHPNVLNLVRPKTTNDKFHGASLSQILIDGLSIMEAISNQIANYLHSLCSAYPRLFFLSDGEVVQLLSVKVTPTSLLPFVRKFFKGVQCLEVEETSNTTDLKAICDCHKQKRVLGVFGSLQEHITFLSPLELNTNPLLWLSMFEEQLKFTMKQLMKQCADEQKLLDPSIENSACDDSQVGHGNGLPLLDLTSKYPLQCLLVVVEITWYRVLHLAFQESNAVKLSTIKRLNCAQLENLCQYLRDTGSSKYTMTCLRMLVLLTIKHAQQLTQLMQVQCPPESSFEWLSSLKYCTTSKDPGLKETDEPQCYVHVMDYRLQYGYEYFGPECWRMVHTPCTDQGMMGILLAVMCYRCGFVSGPRMSGKTKTVVHLGKALGRLVVMLHCCPNMARDIFQKMLLGALLTGAWFVLDSVDLLPQGVQASLAQQLEEIYQSLSGLSRQKKQGVKKQEKTDLEIVFSGVNITASPNYGCVLISSKEHTSEISQSLRFSTRPVALIHPNYGIITEVMLTSFGFTEAKSLSQRLVSLISFTKDCLCLPDFNAQGQGGHLVLLQSILSASKKQLKEIILDPKFSGKSRQSLVIQAVLTSPENDNVEEFNEDQQQAIIPRLLEEIAFVKAIHSVLSQIIYVPEKASQFNSIFKDMFPIACQLPFILQYTKEEQDYGLKEAVKDELEQQLCQSNSEIICQVFTLYQTLRFSQAVILVGPSGSGKTTCYNTLAGALSKLADKTDHISGKSMLKTDNPCIEQISAINWSFVNTVVLFPNALSHEELFGRFSDKIGWQDGAMAKALRDSGRHKPGNLDGKSLNHKTKAEKWLVMDGKPVGQPGWLDHMGILSNYEEPSLTLPSGETLVPSQSHFKLLVETTDLSHASPSAMTHCSLIHFAGTDLWKDVWKSEMDLLYYRHILDQETLKMWTELAEDLFSSTLRALKKNGISTKGQSYTYGLTEIMSFIRILRALLQHFSKELKKDEEQKDSGGADFTINKEIFLLAYVWGFGGNLHSRLWPQFDVVARQELVNCRYKVVFPDEGTVFEFFFSIDSRIYSNNTMLTKSITPKYWKYTCLLTVMLEANQPVLLAGEPGSGKTTVCNTLLRFDKPHIKLPASSMRGPTDLRHLLCGISHQRTCQNTKGVMSNHPGLLLYVDDLHEAPCDVTGKISKILETLRQSISKSGVIACDTHHFKVLSPGTITYLATCCIFELDNPHVNVISSRLSRLFSIFVLPSLTTELILSIHSPQLKLWLKDMSLIPSVTDMVNCIITATKNLYEDVCNHFQPTPQKPCFMFSHIDLQKVFQGLCLWRPDLPKTETQDANLQSKCSPICQDPLVTELYIAHLWMHECKRTFGDRISSEDENKTLESLITKEASAQFRLQLPNESYLDTIFLQSSASHTAHLDPASEPKPTASTEPLSILLEKNSCEVPRRQSQFIKHLQEVTAKLTYGPQHFEDSIFKCNCSYQPRDIDALVQDLSALIDMKEDNKEQEIDVTLTSKYVVHRQRMHQLLHIIRALLIPGGHGVLMASDRNTGRKTTVRLAAYVTGCHLIEVHAGNENQLHTILKDAGNRTQVSEVYTVILVHENISSSVRDELLVALRAYPGLYTDQELAKLVSRVTAVNKTKKFLLDSWIFDKSLCQNLRDVHVFLLMPFVATANSGNHECKAQMTKALGLCCVELYKPWYNQSLVEVAAQFLTKIGQNVKIQGSSQAGMAAVMAGIHQSAYHYICKVLHKELDDRTNRLNAGLSHLDALDIIAMKYKQDLIRVQRKVAEIQQRANELQGAIDHQNSLLKKTEKKCAAQERKIEILEAKIAASEKVLRPFFVAALTVLESLDPLDLEEVRHYREPPDGVVMVMDAICVLFDRPPGWDNAKRLFGQCNLYKCLELFDFYGITDRQMRQLGQLITNPTFVPECVREVSRACEALSRWVLAVYRCGCMRHQLVIRKQLDGRAKEAEARLQQIKSYMEDINHRLKDLRVKLQPVQKLLNEQLLLLHEAEDLERKAAYAVELLARHAEVWRAAAQESLLERQRLPGDAMILAAIMSYLGPFAADVRTELLSKWKELCQTGSIDTNPKDPRSSLIASPDITPTESITSFPVALSEMLRQPLCRALGIKHDWPLQDTSSTRLEMKLLLWGCRRSWVKHWPLLADTQHHLEISSHNGVITGETGDDTSLGKELECEIVVSADDPRLLVHLSLAAEKGLKVLVTHVERATASPHFLARLSRSGGCCPPGLKQTPHQTHRDFCLFLSTHLPARLLSSAVHPSILAQVFVVDLSPSSDQIQELMLTQLLQSEFKAMLIQHLRIQNDKQLLQKKLATEEDSVLDAILQSNATLMQESGFLSHVAVVQESMTYTQTEIQLVNEVKEYLEPLLDAPHQLVKLAVLFYQALQQVSRLSPAYYFPLSGFLAVMHEAFVEKGRTLVSYATGQVLGGVIPEIRNKMVGSLLFHYRPRLFKSHSAVLKLLLTLAVMQHNQLCSPPERTAFLKGINDIQKLATHASPSSTEIPSWISPHVHPDIICLEKMSSFRGLTDSLASSHELWQEYLRSPSSVVTGPVPCDSHSHLSLMQRALLLKTLSPHCMEELAKAMATCQPCPPLHTAAINAPHCGNPKALHPFLVNHEGPIILIWPCLSKDKWTSIQPLLLVKQLACIAADTKEVKVIFTGGCCDSEVTISTLGKAVRDGHWLVFNDCHLLEQWDANVVAHLNQLVSPSMGRGHMKNPHPNFRMWFLTEETSSSSSIPASVRMRALPLVCDTSWDVKEELSCSLQLLSSIVQRQTPAGIMADNMELLLRCATFHTVLIQREAYKYLSQARMYSWNQADLLALAHALISIASLCHDKTKALQYIAVNLVYGGHVLESIDSEVVRSNVDTCFSTEPLLDSGPQMLANIISSAEHRDLSKLIQVLNRHLLNSLDISDPALLGYSADVPAEIIKINSHKLITLLQVSQAPGGITTSSSRDIATLPKLSHARERLQALQDYLTHENNIRTRNAGPVFQSPLYDFLLAEWNALSGLVSSLLSQLRQPLRYMAAIILSFPDLTALSRLERRAELLSAYLWRDNTSAPRSAYRLSAFTNARGLLVALMRRAAQLHHKYISDITLHFEVHREDAFFQIPPRDAVYLCGLQLRGASWEAQIGALENTLSPQPCSMPLICVMARVKELNFLPSRSALPIYQCPIYVEDLNTGEEGLADFSSVATVPLPCNSDPSLCSLRVVRLVSKLCDS